MACLAGGRADSRVDGEAGAAAGAGCRQSSTTAGHGLRDQRHASQARHRQQLQPRVARRRLLLPRGGQTFREDMRRVLTMRAFSQ